MLEQKAVSSEPGTIRLYLAAENKGDHRIYQPSNEDREYVEVEAIALDDDFADDLSGIDFVKVDTQGAEVLILRGMKQILGEARELRMAVEYWPWGLADFGFTEDQLLEIATEAGFRMFDLTRNPALPIRETDPADLHARYTKRSRAHSNLLLLPRSTPDDWLKAQGKVRLLSERAHQ